MGLQIIIFLLLSFFAHAEPLPKHEGLYPLSETTSIEITPENALKRDNSKNYLDPVLYVQQRSFPWLTVLLLFFLLIFLPLAIKLIPKK